MKVFEITDQSDGAFYKAIREVVNLLNKDEVCIVPTDSVYSFCCSINSKKKEWGGTFFRRMIPWGYL